MYKYDGITTIDFHINRIKDLQTDAYRIATPDDDPEREEELILQIEGRSYFTPGRMSGPPESCFPDEGETEILSIKWKGKIFPLELTDSEEEQAKEQISNEIQDDDGGGPPSFDSYEADDRDYDPDY